MIVTPGLTRGPALFMRWRMERERQGGWVYIMADRYRGTMYVGVDRKAGLGASPG